MLWFFRSQPFVLFITVEHFSLELWFDDNVENQPWCICNQCRFRSAWPYMQSFLDLCWLHNSDGFAPDPENSVVKRWYNTEWFLKIVQVKSNLSASMNNLQELEVVTITYTAMYFVSWNSLLSNLCLFQIGVAYILYSDGGLTPCTDCPIDRYWVDGPDRSTCDYCPIGTNTNGRGARNRDDCLGKCGPV